MHGVSQDASQGAGEAGELVHTASKETLGSPDASELGSPQCTKHFDLYNMVVSYKRMALFLEPVTDAVELIRFLLGCVCLSEPHVVHSRNGTFLIVHSLIILFIPQLEDARVLTASLHIPQCLLLHYK